MNLVTLPVSAVKPYANNPRDISASVEVVKASIREFGYRVPIVVDKRHVVILGHTRLEALKQLDVKEIEVVVADLPAAKVKQLRLVDNRASEIAEWDRDRLIAELRAIEGDMGAFFESGEYADLQKELLQVDQRLVTQQELDATGKQLATHFETLSKNMEARTIFVTCKCCGKRFGFDGDIKGFGKEWKGTAHKDTTEGEP